MQDLLIFPFNGNGLEAIDCLGEEYNFLGFVDDTPEKQGVNPYGHQVFDRSAFDKYPNAKVLAVPGGPLSFKMRQDLIGSLQLPAQRFAKVIHPSASVSKHAVIGINCLIMAGVVVTSNAKLGDHICILPNTVIHHDTSVGNYTIIGSGICIAGYTTVGNNCYIGSGSTIINNIRIGDHALIGMGSNVIRNVEDHSKVAGNPAKPI